MLCPWYCLQAVGMGITCYPWKIKTRQTDINCTGWNCCDWLDTYSPAISHIAEALQTRLNFAFLPKCWVASCTFSKHKSLKTPDCHFPQIIHLHLLAHQFPQTQVLQVRPPATLCITLKFWNFRTLKEWLRIKIKHYIYLKQHLFHYQNPHWTISWLSSLRNDLQNRRGGGGRGLPSAWNIPSLRFCKWSLTWSSFSNNSILCHIDLFQFYAPTSS